MKDLATIIYGFQRCKLQYSLVNDDLVSISVKNKLLYLLSSPFKRIINLNLQDQKELRILY